MFNEQRARCALDLKDAEEAILDYLREGADPETTHHIREHSKGFDFYLPWFWTLVETTAAPEGVEKLGFLELERLYMDAAWSLVMKGVLRPGPAGIGGESAGLGGDAYGKGFSLIGGRLTA
jgi:hypothetical protein